MIKTIIVIGVLFIVIFITISTCVRCNPTSKVDDNKNRLIKRNSNQDNYCWSCANYKIDTDKCSMCFTIDRQGKPNMYIEKK